MDPKLFSEKEAVKIIERAAKLQEASREGAETYAPGISESELRRIATEAGIDPQFLEQAMRAPVVPDRRYRLGRLMEETEFVAQGELSEDGWDEIGEAIAGFGTFACLNPTRRHRSYVLQSGWLVQCRVEITSSKGRTRVLVKQSAFLPYMAGMHGPLIAGLAGGFPLVAAFGPVLGFSLIFAILALGALLFTWIQRMVRSKTDLLIQALSQAVQGAKKAATVPHVAEIAAQSGPIASSESSHLETRG